MSETPDYRGYRFPPEIIAHAVWLYHRFTLSFRDVEDLLAERGITLSYETVRQWCHTFGPQYARRIKKRQGPRGDRWFLDEVVVSIQGKRRYLWRAVDQDGDLIDVLVQKRKDTRAAKRFFRKLLRSQTEVPIEITTDKLRSYAAAKRDVMPSVAHCHDQYANNRVEVSHEPTREQERQMRGFSSDGHAQRFLSVHGQVNNLFRLGRHLLRAKNHRVLRERAFETWSQVTCVQ
jgi:putative transposase